MEELIQLCKQNGNVGVTGFTPNEIGNYLEDKGYAYNESESRVSFGYTEVIFVFDGTDGQFEIYVNVVDLEVELTFIPAEEDYWN